jgi:actin-related protein
MTEEQRMQEGRRMFQIFAARMFEQRVLTAYREKVARERQQKLIEELDEEKFHDAAREAKKARDAEKKKQKKQAQKQKLAEEKARKDAEKAAEEAAIKEAEQKRQEELKKRREEQRSKKEEQRKAQEAEIARKNAEKMKRQKEELDRRQEAERKAREQKETERKAREEAKKKEREEREAKEREVKERKAKVDKERKDREAKEKDTQERSRKDSQATQQAHAVQQATQAAKRAVAPAPVPIPPGLQKHPSYSPHVSVATPVIPKAPTPRARQGSQQGSKGSSPKAAHAVTAQAKTGSPPHPGSGPIAPKTILSRPPSQPPVSTAHVPNAASPMHGIPPPPGMPIPHSALFGMPNVNGYPQNHGPMMPQRTMSQTMPGMFSPQAPIGSQFRPFPPNGMPGPPPGMGGAMPPMGRGFPDVPPGFPQQMGPGFGAPGRDTMPAHSGMPQQHSRQQSGSSSIEPPNAIQRPIPGAIQRPSSVKPQDGRMDMDELSRHLGSSALLDDDESPEPPPFQDRRPSIMTPGLPRAGSNLSAAFGSQPLFTNTANQSPFGINAGGPGNTWGAPSNSFGQASVQTGNGWGPSPTSTWPLGSNSLPFGNTAAQSLPGRPRPHQIRVNMCKACQSLSAKGVGTPEGFQTAISILSAIQNSMTPPISEDELDMMVTTEGTAQNGGGSFQVNRLGPEPLNCLIKWIPDGTGDGLQRMGSHGVGEIGGSIGSPIVGPRDPVSANATPFGSMRGFPGSIAGLGGLGSSGL